MRVMISVSINMKDSVALQSEIINVERKDWPALENELLDKMRRQQHNTTGFRYSYLVIDQ